MENVARLTMTTKQYAEHTQIGEKRLREMVHIDGFPALRIGRKLLFVVNECDKWLLDNRHLI